MRVAGGNVCEVRSYAGSILAIAVAFSTALSCGRIGYDPVAADRSDDWWNDAWVGRIELGLDNLGINEDLVNFPVLVRLDSVVFDYSKAEADGSDIRFVSADGKTELAHEIESFAPGGESYIWVSVPKVLADSDEGSIWLYFGNASPGSARRSSEVWQDFHAVYHLSDAVTDSAGGHSGAPGDGEPIQIPAAAAGHIAGAQEFDGIDDIITVNPGESFTFTKDELTAGAWVETGNLRLDWNNFLGIGGYNAGYRMGINGMDGQSGFQCPGATHTMNSMGLEVVPPGWHYIVSTWDGELMRHYFDGVLDVVPLSKTDSIVPSTGPFIIGLAEFPYRGRIDELRVANRVRSVEWIRASIRSMNGAIVIYR
jgi:hypothetical protein